MGDKGLAGHGPDWRRVEEVFGEAAELAGAARSAYLDRACGSDPELRREVESLLAHAAGEEDWGAAARAEAALLLKQKEPGAGTMIGAWRILRRIGAGGMGAVFEAERADGLYEQQVALKLMKPEHAARGDVMARFMRERRILARLEHPTIARLIDGGVTDGGLPYLVMEFVDGVRIDEYVRRHGLSTEERLALMERVMVAVQAAHRNLVVHRDLKPANILVARDGSPKLLDFGIGKILGTEGVDGAHTQVLERVLTPDYASPEQVRGEPITTATDVYALGVILYELLAERRPYEVKTTSLMEVERAIVEGEARPLFSVDRPELKRLRRDELADLDAVVQKALRKEPEARYESAGAMAEDLRRFREGFPVEARQGTRRYAMRKLVRRHWRAFTAAAAFVVLLAVFGLAMAALAAKVTLERDVARRASLRAERVSQYLQGIFQGADPRRAQGEVLTARELLDEGAKRIEKDLALEPAAREEVLNTIAQAYQHLGLYERASELFEKRTAAAREAHGNESLQVVNALRQWGDTERMRSNLDMAERTLRQAKAVLDRRGGPVPEERAHVLNNLALVLQARGRHTESEALLREAVSIIGRFPGQETEWLTMRSNLGGALGELGRLEESEAELRAVLEERRKLLGERHPQVARSLTRLGRALLRRNKTAEAEGLLREALDRSMAVVGAEHLETLSARAWLASARLEAGDAKEAASLLEESIRVGSKSLGAEHLDVLEWKLTLAEAMAAEGRLEEARRVAVPAAAGLEKKLGPGQPRVARARGVVEKISSR